MSTKPLRRREVLAANDRRLPGHVGALAGEWSPHRFRPLSPSQCSACFGWIDDPRHVGEVAVVAETIRPDGAYL